MPNKNYTNGVRREYQTKKVLEERGFLVLRSAGSHGAFDLVGISYADGEVLLVQVKSGGALTPDEKREIQKVQVPYDTEFQVWEYPSRGIVNVYRVTNNTLVKI